MDIIFKFIHIKQCSFSLLMKLGKKLMLKFSFALNKA